MTTPTNGQPRRVPNAHTEQPQVQVRPTETQYTTRTVQTAPDATSTAYTVETQPADNQHTGQEAWIGTDNTDVSQGNISWGAIFAGVVTFISIMVIFGLVASAMGLQRSTGLATGITTVKKVVIL